MSRPNEPSRPDLYTRITHQIVAQLEAGVRPWSQPWAASESVSRPLRHDGTPCRPNAIRPQSDQVAGPMPAIFDPSRP